MADPTDRTIMDDLTDAVTACDVVCCRTCAEETLTAVQAFLRERGLLLGPDGLLRAEERHWCTCGDLFTLSPLDPPEDTP